MMLDRNLKILIVSPEVAPFAKTGGLADVAGSLPKALATIGNDVRVVMPRYRQVADELETLADYPVPVGERRETAVLRRTFIEAKLNDIHRNVPVYFIDNYHYFDREGMYVFHDEAERYAFFCRAVLEMCPRINFKPDIIHLNDWQTGPISLLLREQYRDNPFYRRTVTVFTIHNLRYQGNFPREVLGLLGLGDEYFQPGAVEFYGQVSFMKAGIVYSDVVNTVSPTYAEEIQTPEYGEGMDGLLRSRCAELFGIVNGINYHEFNPATDPRIYKNYDVNNIDAKRENKYALQREMGLPTADAPVIGLVSRLVDQKGLDLISEAIGDIMEMQLQFVVLGTGDHYYEQQFEEMRRRYPDKMGVLIGFNGVLAQKIYAGADLFLMPSRFEPCGLGQLISLRYGTIPIVRHTGGLKDTIQQFDPATGIGNGFAFKEYSAKAMLGAIKKAVDTYTDKGAWRKLVQAAMQQDFSWNRSAAEYMELYDKALEKAGAELQRI